MPDRFRWRLADLLILLGLFVIYALVFSLDYDDGLVDRPNAIELDTLAARYRAVDSLNPGNHLLWPLTAGFPNEHWLFHEL